MRLRDEQGNYYSPADEESGPLQQALLSGGNTALYRQNTFFFGRTGRNILEEATSLYLRVSPTGGSTAQLGWSWPPMSKRPWLQERALFKANCSVTSSAGRSDDRWEVTWDRPSLQEK